MDEGNKDLKINYVVQKLRHYSFVKMTTKITFTLVQFLNLRIRISYQISKLCYKNIIQYNN